MKLRRYYLKPKEFTDIFLFDFIKSVNFLKQKNEVALSEIKKIKNNDPLFKEFQNSLDFLDKNSR